MKRPGSPAVDLPMPLPRIGERTHQEMDVVIGVVGREPDPLCCHDRAVRRQRIVLPVGDRIAFPGIAELGLDLALQSKPADEIMVKRVYRGCFEALEC